MSWLIFRTSLIQIRHKLNRQIMKTIDFLVDLAQSTTQSRSHVGVSEVFGLPLQDHSVKPLLQLLKSEHLVAPRDCEVESRCLAVRIQFLDTVAFEVVVRQVPRRLLQDTQIRDFAQGLLGQVDGVSQSREAWGNSPAFFVFR